MLRSILLASAALSIAAPAAAQSFDSAAISGLGVRNIGSATMSGRIAAVAGRQEKDGKVTLLIGSASGGVWKSEDGGTTFKPVFEQPNECVVGQLVQMKRIFARRPFAVIFLVRRRDDQCTFGPRFPDRSMDGWRNDRLGWRWISKYRGKIQP